MFALLKVNVMLALLQSFINSMNKSATKLEKQLGEMHKEEVVLAKKDQDKAIKKNEALYAKTDKQIQEAQKRIQELEQKKADARHDCLVRVNEITDAIEEKAEFRATKRKTIAEGATKAKNTFTALDKLINGDLA